MKLLIYIIFLFAFGYSAAQYKPLESNNALKGRYIERCKALLKADKSYIKSKYSENSKEIIKTFELRTNQNIANAENGHYVFDVNAQQYFDGILDKVANANPFIDLKNIWIVLGKSSTPNAYSVGDGTLVINYGIILHIKNESQLAFIICHEISHFLLDHSNKRIINQFYSKESETFKNKLKDISNSEFNQAAQLKQLVKSYLYDSRRYSRKNEYDADSVGIALAKYAGYNTEQAISTMDMLETLNTNIDTSIVNFGALFKDIVMVQAENSSFISKVEKKSELETDSIETHPDCPERKLAMFRQLGGRNINTQAQQKTEYFNLLKEQMVFEQCEALMMENQFDLSLLYGLRQLQKGNEDVYFKSSVLHSLYSLYSLRKNHKLGYYTQSPIDISEPTHKQLSEYLYYSRLSSLSKAAFQYGKTLIPIEMAQDRDLYVLTMLAQATDNQTEMEFYKNTLFEQYSNSKYLRLVPSKK